ncbi:PQ-loop-domain-containing protein [Schizopora paradoxa]|uniref:PQ-loop-domain-containing protein n=1 Tax=Schizopora paradoxa TaxID=27342 RepID=A0A0H2S580_9AGAM|nr:PQ-loop-domain-containing protein [Schizopora paradoxa]
MRSNPAAENVLGTIGTICWTIQILPQIWKSWREKATEGLSPWLMFLWGVAAVFLAVYNVTQDLNVPLIVQPQIFGTLAFVSWSQCIYYDMRKPLRYALACLALSLAIFAGFEAGMVFAVKSAVNKGNHAPVTFFGVATSVVLSAGLLPQYLEIYRLGEVKGISIPFMTVDLLGGVFSALSLVFKSKFDVLAGVAYSLVVVLDAVVVLLALILNPIARRRRARLENTTSNGESRFITHMETGPPQQVPEAVRETPIP